MKLVNSWYFSIIVFHIPVQKLQENGGTSFPFSCPSTTCSSLVTHWKLSSSAPTCTSFKNLLPKKQINTVHYDRCEVTQCRFFLFRPHKNKLFIIPSFIKISSCIKFFYFLFQKCALKKHKTVFSNACDCLWCQIHKQGILDSDIWDENKKLGCLHPIFQQTMNEEEDDRQLIFLWNLMWNYLNFFIRNKWTFDPVPAWIIFTSYSKPIQSRGT